LMVVGVVVYHSYGARLFTAETAAHQWVNTLRRREENRIYLYACSGKSEAKITNNRRLRSTYCAVEANYWHTRSIARPFCDSRAICFIPLHSTPTLGGPRRNIAIPFGMEKLEWCAYPTVKKAWCVCSHFDRIPACIGQTGRQTSCDSIVRAVHSIAR